VEKWPLIRNKIDESNCEIFCFQETKKEMFDLTFIKNFAPRRFDKFIFAPSIGASGGILVCWNGSLFDGTVIDVKPFAISISFSSRLDLNVWNLTSVYGPCLEPARTAFINWLRNLDILDDLNWILMGDFNFYRYMDNRNKSGGNFHDTQIFNEVIDHLGLVELPLKGRAFTWSNMQSNPLLEQLDWFFTSANWTLDFPNTMVTPMARPTSDHVPCRVSVETKIPKSNVFRFENFWVSHGGFLSTVELS
jgi:exonuclease III